MPTQTHYDNTGREMTVNKDTLVYAQAVILLYFWLHVHAVPYIRKGKYQDSDLQQKNKLPLP